VAIVAVRNRLLTSTGSNLCLDVGIREIVIVLGDGAAAVEEAWETGRGGAFTVSLQFFSRRPGAAVVLVPQPGTMARRPVVLAAPLFPRRLGTKKPGAGDRERLCYRAAGIAAAFLCNDPAYLAALLEGGAGSHPPVARPFSETRRGTGPRAHAARSFDAICGCLRRAGPLRHLRLFRRPTVRCSATTWSSSPRPKNWGLLRL